MLLLPLDPRPKLPLHPVIPGPMMLLSPPTSSPTPGLSSCSKNHRPRPQFHRRAIHACTSDTGTITMVSAHVPQARCCGGSACTEPRTLTLLPLWVPVHQTWHYEGCQELELLSIGKKGVYQQLSSLRTSPTLATTTTGRAATVLDTEIPTVFTTVDLSWWNLKNN